MDKIARLKEMRKEFKAFQMSKEWEAEVDGLTGMIGLCDDDYYSTQVLDAYIKGYEDRDKEVREK